MDDAKQLGPAPALDVADQNAPDLGARDALIEEALAANDGSLPLDFALDLFVSIYGEVPGGHPSLPAVRPGDGSLAIRAVGAHWDDLDEEQRDSIQELLDPAMSPEAARPEDVELVLAARPAHAQSSGESDEWVDILAEAASDLADEIGARLGTGLSARLEVEAAPATTWRRNVSGDAAPVRQSVVAWSGVHDTCRIRINRSLTEPAVTLAHEVFHCFQFEMAPLSVVYRTQEWILEGSAEWAAATVRPPDDDTRAYYETWLDHRGSLFALDYPAVGFFWTIESLGVDPWSVIPHMVGRRNASAVDVAGLERADVARRMAAGAARRSNDGLDVDDLWDLTPPHVPPIGGRRMVELLPASPLRVNSAARGWFSRGGVVVANVHGVAVELEMRASAGAVQIVGGELIEFTEGLERTLCMPDDATAHQIIFSGARVEPGTVRYDAAVIEGPEAAMACWVEELNAREAAQPLTYAGPCPDPVSVPFDNFVLCSTLVEGADLPPLPWDGIERGDTFHVVASIGDFHPWGWVRLSQAADGQPRVVEYRDADEALFDD